MDTKNGADVVLDTERHRTEFRSGGLVYAEEYRDGRLLPCQWGTPLAAIPDRHFNLQCHVFGLQVDGQDLQWGWRLVSARTAGTAAAPEAVVELLHERVPVRVHVHTKVDGTPFFQRWLEIRNEGTVPVGISAADVWSGFPAEGEAGFPERDSWTTPYSLGRFAGDNWAMEGRFVWEPLSNGVACRLGMRGPYGTSGYQCPFFLLRRDRAPEQYTVFSLAWSGPWCAEVTSDSALYRVLQVRAGLEGPAPLRVLASGETAATPALHVGSVTGDFDACIQAIHAHVRRSVAPASPTHHRHPMTECNSWTKANLRVTEATMVEDVADAQELGCEVYMQDAGWYGGAHATAEDRNKSPYPRYMGDWVPGPWLPNGFGPARAAMRKRGLLFGLWIEPEGVGLRSTVAARHPEWFARQDGRPVPDVMERLNLDLAHPEAAAWLESELERIIRDYGVDVLRLDGGPMSARIGERPAAGRVENSAWRHVEALYGVLERTRRRFPDLLIENCCGGGGRNDWGMMSRTHWAQLSDEHRPAESLMIANGMTMFLPPELCENIFGVVLQGQPFKAPVASLYRLLLMGRPIPLPPDVDPDRVRNTRRYFALFKDFLVPMLSTCKVFHHTPVIRLEGENRSTFCIVEYAAADEHRSSVWVFQFPEGRRSVTVCPRGVDGRSRYRVTSDSDGTSYERDGADLRSRGVEVALDGVLSSDWLRIERI